MRSERPCSRSYQFSLPPCRQHALLWAWRCSSPGVRFLWSQAAPLAWSDPGRAGEPAECRWRAAWPADGGVGGGGDGGGV